jgi:hypothetical protein
MQQSTQIYTTTDCCLFAFCTWILTAKEHFEVVRMKNTFLQFLQERSCSVPTPFSRQDLVEAGLLATHNYGLLKTAYKNCFVGSEVVTWMVDTSLAETRESAVEMCRTMLAGAVIHHVCDEHHFEDGYYFYRYISDDNIAPATAAAKAADLETHGSGRATRRGSVRSRSSSANLIDDTSSSKTGVPHILVNVWVDVPGVKDVRILAEIQIHCRQVLEIGMSDHKLYEIIRADSMAAMRGIGASNPRTASLRDAVRTTESTVEANSRTDEYGIQTRRFRSAWPAITSLRKGNDAAASRWDGKDEGRAPLLG